MRGLRDVAVSASCLLVLVALIGCSGNAPQELVAGLTTDATPAILLVGIHSALDGGDVIEATRLADLARETELTAEQVGELASLVARFGQSDPTVGMGAPDAAPPTHDAPSPARAVDGQRSGAALTPTYEGLPFFGSYRDEAAGGRSAWFELGTLSVSPAETLAPALHRRGARGDQIVILDFSEFLASKGIDDALRLYHGLTRVRHGAMLHHYVDATGRATTGTTRLRDDGTTRTVLLRHERQIHEPVLGNGAAEGPKP
jgi:hypothetical protein